MQRKRTKGWRMPEGAVYVGRGSMWGNPFKDGTLLSRPGAVMAFRLWVEAAVNAPYRERARAQLRGHDLACWCPPDQPCHADVLLEIANA